MGDQGGVLLACLELLWTAWRRALDLRRGDERVRLELVELVGLGDGRELFELALHVLDLGGENLGLGSAEIKVVATAWNRHLLLYNNARIYAYRAWSIQFLLYYLGLTSTAMSIFISNSAVLKTMRSLSVVMLLLPIATALLGTVSTRLRTKQKYRSSHMPTGGSNCWRAVLGIPPTITPLKTSGD